MANLYTDYPLSKFCFHHLLDLPFFRLNKNSVYSNVNQLFASGLAQLTGHHARSEIAEDFNRPSAYSILRAARRVRRVKELMIL